MAAPRKPGRGSAPELAKRMDPAQGLQLTPEQQLHQRLLQRRLRVRNALTALTIGSVVAGIYGYTIYRISQEQFLDELEQEVEAARTQSAKTSTN